MLEGGDKMAKSKDRSHLKNQEKRLTKKQKLFADYYLETGNITESARKAGYKHPNVVGTKVLDLISVQEYINKQNEKIESDKIASIKEIQEFWTATFKSEDMDFKDRLKASELLAKSKGGFLDKVQVDGNVSGEIEIVIGGDDFGD